MKKDIWNETIEEWLQREKERNPNLVIGPSRNYKSTKRDWLAENITSREQAVQLKKWLRLLDNEHKLLNYE